MKQIIIKTDRANPDSFLISCLRRLFPECEIQVVRGEDDAVIGYPNSADTMIDPTDRYGGLGSAD